MAGLAFEPVLDHSRRDRLCRTGTEISELVHEPKQRAPHRPALGATIGVPLESATLHRDELTVHVGRHAPRSPPMLEPLAHRSHRPVGPARRVRDSSQRAGRLAVHESSARPRRSRQTRKRTREARLGQSSDRPARRLRNARRHGSHGQCPDHRPRVRGGRRRRANHLRRAGVKWIPALLDDDHKYHRLFESVREHVVGACAYCARAYGVKDVIEESDIPLTAEYRDHPSIRTLIVKGYQVVTF